MPSSSRRSLLVAAATAIAACTNSVTFVQASSSSSSSSSNIVTPGLYTVNLKEQAQVILGIGFEIQSDSIGSGNHGLPEVNTSVPWDLVPSERTRLYEEMVQGFRYVRLALGLYFRGLTPDNKNIVERWPGQAAVLAEMIAKGGLEGAAAEYWSPTPAWKSTNNYTDGTLISFNASTLNAFGAAVVQDIAYLQANNIPVTWFGLQNEPPVGPTGCIYSCCGYSASQYYEAFSAVIPQVVNAFPHINIHASSWSGQHYSPQLTNDSNLVKHVDLWTFHDVGGNSNDQIAKQAYYLQDTQGIPVANNEYEYLDDYTTPERTINTIQSLMNWMNLESSPTFFWLHILKPIINAEASGYSLGFWQPWIDPSPEFPLPSGYFDYNVDNWPSFAGLIKYMPWNSVRVNVTEDLVNGSLRGDARILTYLFDPQMARWTKDDLKQPKPAQSTRETLNDETAVRAAASKLGMIITNRFNITGNSPSENVYNATINLNGIDTSQGLPVFMGKGFASNVTDQDLGTQQAQMNSTTGIPYISVSVGFMSIQFWVQQ